MSSDFAKTREFVKVLSESLPYITRLAGKTIVIKYGGNAMTEEKLKKTFARDIVMLKTLGINPVVVHGGGPQIGDMLEKLDISSKFIDGMRVTDSKTMEIIEMVLGGKINKEIVELISQAGGNAVGLSGKDSRLILAKKYINNSSSVQENQSGWGFVGDVEKVNQSLVDSLTAEGFIPVIAPIGVDTSGVTYNINADIAASKIAQALRAEKLLLLTNVEGILDEDGELIQQLSKTQSLEMISKGKIKDGMIPKIRCALEAVSNEVQTASIVDGRIPNAILIEIFTDNGMGTIIK